MVDYGAGNLTSVVRALERLDAPYVVAQRPEGLERAYRLIFPGVGHAASAMANLWAAGWVDVLREWVERGRPMLGICLGCQIVLDESEEGPTACLGLVKGRARRFPQLAGLKVPHMGWNTVVFQDHPVFRSVPSGASFYFVHSYYPEVTKPEHRLGLTEYGLTFTSALGWGSLVAVQFHPEKSGESGLAILNDFLRWSP